MPWTISIINRFSDDERARVYLCALKPEQLDHVIAAYMNEQEVLRAGGSYCSNEKCLRLIYADDGLEMLDITYKLIGKRMRRVCCLECLFVAGDQRIDVECNLYQLDKSMTWVRAYTFVICYQVLHCVFKSPVVTSVIFWNSLQNLRRKKEQRWWVTVYKENEAKGSRKCHVHVFKSVCSH